MEAKNKAGYYSIAIAFSGAGWMIWLEEEHKPKLTDKTKEIPSSDTTQTTTLPLRKPLLSSTSREEGLVEQGIPLLLQHHSLL